MHRNAVAQLLLGGLGMASAMNVERQAGPPPNQVQLVSVAAGGKGCPAGSIAKQFSDSRDVLTLIFDSYNAQSGPGVSVTDHRSACQVNIKMRFPEGYQFGVLSADYRGFAQIPAGSSGVARSTYYFSGSRRQVNRNVAYTGPLNGDYLKTDRIPIESVLWSPCGKEALLNVKTSIELNPRTADTVAQMQVDSADIKYTQQYQLYWRPCGASSTTAIPNPTATVTDVATVTNVATVTEGGVTATVTDVATITNVATLTNTATATLATTNTATNTATSTATATATASPNPFLAFNTADPGITFTNAGTAVSGFTTVDNQRAIQFNFPGGASATAASTILIPASAFTGGPRNIPLSVSLDYRTQAGLARLRLSRRSLLVCTLEIRMGATTVYGPTAIATTGGAYFTVNSATFSPAANPPAVSLIFDCTASVAATPAIDLVVRGLTLKGTP